MENCQRIISLSERTIAQAIVLLRAAVRAKFMDPPLSVALVVGSSGEAQAWRDEAIAYLTARAEGINYAPSTVSLGDQYHDEG